ncbi:uncharacterized protein si:dkey-196h17.9 isoform X2 [Pygocentrus nattereri]|uniref:uncharacterized protein si:dkey-196h17.9 isoform X2 n=1 Tax=Pygocentrus nattereri TaxID=42514 RepID=UPI0008143791|nr:uncharacterized protein si:dkey-196h17.9 isoform X2 [Pygocentrus nattereri]
MSKVLKTLNDALKRRSCSRDRDSSKPLVSNMISQLNELMDGDSITQTCHRLNSTDQCGTDPEIQAQGPEDEGQRVLSILSNVLLGDLRSQELKQAAEQVKQWAKVNGITPEGKEGSYSQNWLREYLNIIEKSVDKHFPALQPEGSRDSQLQTGEYLKLALSLVWSEVIGLVPVLENSRLLSYLIDSYNRRLFAVLDLFVDRSSSVKEVSILLVWVKQTYFSHGFTGSPNIQDHVLRVSDPLLLTDWFEKSKQRFLTLLQKHISTVLQNILLYSEAHLDCRNEEDLIKVYLDVIQCLDAALQGSKIISETLMTAVKSLCYNELHTFVERYVSDEKKQLEAQKSNETYSFHLFRIVDTCKHLRSYCFNILDSNNDTNSPTLKMLENMEDHVSSIVQQWFAGLAEDHLKKYFKEKDVHIYKLMDMIKNVLAPLPLREQGERTKQHIVNAAYQGVTRAYLQCLMQRKCKQLERRWGDVDKRMMRDAELFHSTFTQLSISDDEQKNFLLKMSEILNYNDTNSLKVSSAELYRDFPKESEEHLPALLKWKRGLSKRQMKEIMVVSQEACQNGEHITPCRLKYWSCCLCCA